MRKIVMACVDTGWLTPIKLKSVGCEQIEMYATSIRMHARDLGLGI